MSPAAPTSIFGQIYIGAGDAEPGIGSYHFVSASESYISYEHERSKDVFPRLDVRRPGQPGERLPSRLPFSGATYDPSTRTFRGFVSFSVDRGSYEEVRTIDGVEREEHELVFSEDFEEVVDAQCHSWYPNASRSHRSEDLGRLVRWSGGGALRSAMGPAATMSTPAPSAPSVPAAATSSADVAQALLARDERGLRRALEAGAGACGDVESPALWERLRWQVGEDWLEAWPRTALLAAAVLLQWPEGVRLCVLHGADVNGLYAGPLGSGEEAHGDEGKGGGEGEGIPLLRLALSVRSQAQCLICRYILDGGVDAKVFQRTKKRAQSEMEVDTKDLFARWQGPFKGAKH